MKDTTYLGTLSEIKIMAKFIEDGYEVYNQINGKSSIDMVVMKDENLYKVSCKSTMTMNRQKTGWSVQLRTVRPNRTTCVIKNFDNTTCDILAIYIEPEDRILIFKSLDVNVKTSMVIPMM